MSAYYTPSNAVVEAMSVHLAAGAIARVIATGHEVESKRGLVDLEGLAYRERKGSSSTYVAFPKGLPAETKAGMAVALGIRW